MMNSPQFSEEEEIARLVRSTLNTAAQMGDLRLKQLMPPIPASRRKRLLFSGWQRQLTMVCLALVLCLGVYGLYQANHQSAWQGPSPTTIAITATFTTEPTATESNEGTATETVTAVETQAAILATLPPRATPVAALSTTNILINNN
jgi:hypothetical protein